MVAKVL